MTDGKKPETPRVDALSEVHEGFQEEMIERYKAMKAEWSARDMESQLTLDDKLATAKASLIAGLYEGWPDGLEEIQASIAVHKRLIAAAEQRAEQALALRGEPVAKEKINEIAWEIAQLTDGLNTSQKVQTIATGILKAVALYAAPISGERATRDWTEDYAHENGNYQCLCGDCGQVFYGHKRRVTCKLCAAVSGERAGEKNSSSGEVPRDEGNPDGRSANVETPSVSGERVREACARACEKRAEERFAEHGTTESDTGASYYGGRCEDEYNARDEEDDECAAAIRALPLAAIQGETNE